MKRQTAFMLVKLLTGLSIFTGIIAAIFLFALSSDLQKKNSSTSLTPIPTPVEEEKFCGGPKDIQCPTGSVCIFEGDKYLTEGGRCVKNQPRPQSSEGEFCGGIAGIQCSEGFTCKLDGNYPDAGGTCIKEESKSPEEGVMCTMDAKQCPDGSWVGRTGPKCEFVCPDN